MFSHGRRLFCEERLEVLADAVEPGVAARARGGGALEAVAAQREGVELALDAHRAHLFPGLDGVHRGVGVGVAVQEEHRGGVEVEAELRRVDGRVVISPGGIAPLHAVRQDVGGIDADAPLDLAGDAVDGVDGVVGGVPRGGHAHQGQVAAGGGAHDPDAVGIESALRRLAAHDADGALEVLPGGGVLGQARRAGGAVFERDDGHAHRVQVAARRGDLEGVRVVGHVGAAGVDDLDGAGLAHRGDVPLDVGLALVVARVGHFPFGPDVLADQLRPVGVAGETALQRHFRLQGAQEAHLPQEFDAALEAVGAVALVRVEVQLGGDLHPAQLAVHEGGPVRGIGIRAAVVQAHRAGLLVELEDLAELHVHAVALAGGGDALRVSVGGHVGRGVDDGEIDMARDVVQRVDACVGRGLRAGGEQERQVRSGGHADHTDAVGVEAALFRLAAHEAHGALTVFPGGLPVGDALRARGAVHEVHALDARGGELLVPFVNQTDVHGTLVGAAGDQDHAGAVAHFLRGGLVPFEKGRPVLLDVESRRAELVGHGGILPRLRVGHLARRPKGFALESIELQRSENQQKCK